MTRSETSVFGGTIEHPNFKTFSGRARELSQLIRGLTDSFPASFCIEGPTKIGASAIIKNLWDLQRKNDGFWIENGSTAGLEVKIFRFDCSSKTIRDVNLAISEAIITQEDGANHESISGSEISNETVRRYLQTSPYRYIFCLPNFEEPIKNGCPEDEPEFKFLASLMDFQSFVFTVDRPIQEFPFLARIKNLSTIRLGLLRRDEAQNYLRTAFAKCKQIKYLSEPIENLLLDLSGCHPYLLYQISEVYFWVCQQNQLQTPTEIDDQRIESLILNELHPAGNLYYVFNFLKDIWSSLTPDEKNWIVYLLNPSENGSANMENNEIISKLNFLQLISYNPHEKKFSIASRIFSEYLQIYEFQPIEDVMPNHLDNSLIGTTKKEDLLLKLFVSNPDVVLTNEEISLEIYGISIPGKAEIHKLNTLVGRLRNRLSHQYNSSGTDLIRNVYGKGFRFNPPPK